MISEQNICEYIKNQNADDILVDLRNSEMFAFGSIEGAVNIPLDNISGLYDLPKNKKIYLFCQVGDYSAEIAQLLSDSGYDVCNLLGGYREYMRFRLAQLD